MAVHSCETLKDFYPDAHVTLFTHEKFLDGKEKIFDNVVTDIPIHMRAKMWGMSHSPYERTVYIDADTEVWSEDIKIIHQELDDCDMFFTRTPIYSAGNIKWIYVDKAMTKRLYWQGGMCGFVKNDLTHDFVSTWYNEYLKQQSEPWPYPDYNDAQKQWDMFTLWKITNHPEFDRFKDLKIKEVNVKYNFCCNYLQEELRGHEPCIVQYSRDAAKASEIYRKRFYNDEKTYFSKQEINCCPPKNN
jgi:hypothetical protein